MFRSYVSLPGVKTAIKCYQLMGCVSLETDFCKDRTNQTNQTNQTHQTNQTNQTASWWYIQKHFELLVPVEFLPKNQAAGPVFHFIILYLLPTSNGKIIQREKDIHRIPKKRLRIASGDFTLPELEKTTHFFW